MKASLLKKFSVIIIASSLFTFTVDAQIVYTDVNPDITISNGSYNLDLNNDGIIDFVLSSQDKFLHCTCGSGGPSRWAHASPQNSNMIVAIANNSDSIARLIANKNINSFLSWGNAHILAIRKGECNSGLCLDNERVYISFPSSGRWSYCNGYIGLKLKVGLNIYYGWVRLYVGLDGSSVRIYDYAYNSVPNQPILAGQTCPPQAKIIADGPTTFCASDSVILSSANTGNSLSYRWMLNGKTITGATTKRYAAKVAGDYRLIVKDTAHRCSDTSGKRTVIINCLQSNLAVSHEKLISKTTQIQITPNPFSKTTTVSFTLLQPQKVTVGIYDITGRLVKTLNDVQMQAGTHQLVWNGEDEKGNAVGAGFYLLKMQAGNYSEAKKLSLVK